MKLSTRCFLFAIFLSTICFAARGNVGFDYSQGTLGPSNWGNLQPNWCICSTGIHQSPINIANAVQNPNLFGLLINYISSPAVLKNRHKDIAVEWPDGAGTVTFNGIQYTLIELHWHIHSEHTINGIVYDLEMHLVHSGPPGLLVIGVLFAKSLIGSDPFLSSLLGQLALIATGVDEVALGSKQPPSVSCLSRYYLYKGSLTTPPCSESVTWIVLHDVQQVNDVEFFVLQNAMDPNYQKNARPIQPLNGRIISKY